MKIGFMTVDWYMNVPESSGFYRSYIPYRGLARNGYVTTIGARMKASRFGWRLLNPIHGGQPGPVPDVLIIQRWMDAEASHAVTWAQKRGQVVLADVDDWMFGLHADNIAHKHMQQQQGSATSLQHYEQMLRQVDGVICSTPFLADKIAKHFNDNVEVVRNSIDPTLWPQRPGYHGARPGWTGAVHWRSRDLEQLKGVIGRVLKDTGTKFVFVGFDGNDEILTDEHYHVQRLHERLGIDEEQVMHVRGTSPSRYPTLLNDSRIGVGLVPLNDVPFNHAKSVVKGMEYAMAGIPFIASPTPEYQWLNETYGVGVLARRPKDWLRHLSQLVGSESLRRTHATWNRQQVLDHLTIDHTYPQWVNAIQSLASNACKDIRSHDILLSM